MTALETQVGGDHYKKLGAYQPWEVLARCMTPDELRGFAKGTMIAYLMRERDKGGLADIAKAVHTGQLFAELLPVCEAAHGAEASVDLSAEIDQLRAENDRLARALRQLEDMKPGILMAGVISRALEGSAS